mmetsp:Transcript_137834/g.428305  ORF Transcript_137834/g.428305 Transcript_137834/m.428305 type:complete len:464 (+) Transcript_137834:248-1639(+)
MIGAPEDRSVGLHPGLVCRQTAPLDVPQAWPRVRAHGRQPQQHDASVRRDRPGQEAALSVEYPIVGPRPQVAHLVPRGAKLGGRGDRVQAAAVAGDVRGVVPVVEEGQRPVALGERLRPNVAATPRIATLVVGDIAARNTDAHIGPGVPHGLRHGDHLLVAPGLQRVGAHLVDVGADEQRGTHDGPHGELCPGLLVRLVPIPSLAHLLPKEAAARVRLEIGGPHPGPEKQVRVVPSARLGVAREVGVLVDGVCQSAPILPITGDAPGIPEGFPLGGVPSVPPTEGEIYLAPRLVQGVSHAGVVCEGSRVVRAPAARVLLQVVRPRFHHEACVLLLVPVSTGCAVDGGPALASAPRGVEPVLHDLPLPRHLLVMDPVAQGLHPGGELRAVLNHAAVGGIPALDPALIDVHMDVALGGQARADERERDVLDPCLVDFRGAIVPRGVAHGRKQAKAVVEGAAQGKG